MAEQASNSVNNQKDALESMATSSLQEFREMVDVALNLDVSGPGNHDNTSMGEESIDAALLSHDASDETSRLNLVPSKTTTPFSVTELPTAVADSLNTAAKQLSHLYESVNSTTTTEHGEELSDENFDATEEENRSARGDDQLTNGLAEPYSAEPGASSTCPKPTHRTTTSPSQSQLKRHIMISYNRSSRETCQKIYDGLVEKDYKVWMDLTDMFDNVLVGMARAVENSYIVLLCINQQYYESEYCRLEAEYAAENRIKFIPCLMESEFRAQSWLGIIKGANVHVDFSSPNQFDESFAELIRQITYVERKLSLQPRRTPAPGPMTNPMKMMASAPPPSAASTLSHDMNSRRFEAIIREYKQSIRKKRHHLNRLKRSELSDLIIKLRQELFSETSQVLSDSERSDDEDEKQQSNDQFLQELLRRSLDQNQVLLNLVDRLTTPQPMEPHSQHSLDLNGIIKVVFAIMLLWTLSVLYQKE